MRKPSEIVGIIVFVVIIIALIYNFYGILNYLWENNLPIFVAFIIFILLSLFSKEK